MIKHILLIASLVVSLCSHAQEQDSLDLMIGQMILIGLGDFNELEKDAPVFQSIAAGKAGGVILFEKNIHQERSADKLKEIIDYAQEQSTIPLWVSIDEEGGRVNRLKTKYGFPKTMTAQYLGEVNSEDSTLYYAGQTAAALYRLGINMNFAPSVDVNVNPQNPVIGSLGRSFSENDTLVAEHASWFIDAHDLMGIATVVKHFPGHGSSMSDSHLGLTDITDTWRLRELFPYQALLDSGKVRAVMTAHIVNEKLDETKTPATLSKQILQGLLRGIMDYDGVVVSDDMQMKAISAQYGLEEAIKMAVNAGVDILLFANNVPDYDLVTADQIHEIIRKFVKNGDISPDRIFQSYKRIMSLKAEMGLSMPN